MMQKNRLAIPLKNRKFVMKMGVKFVSKAFALSDEFGTPGKAKFEMSQSGFDLHPLLQNFTNL
jgi:hypothetical protein